MMVLKIYLYSLKTNQYRDGLYIQDPNMVIETIFNVDNTIKIDVKVGIFRFMYRDTQCIIYFRITYKYTIFNKEPFINIPLLLYDMILDIVSKCVIKYFHMHVIIAKLMLFP